MLRILFVNDYAEIEYDTELQAVILTYKRKGVSDEFRSIHFELLKGIEKSCASRLLVNTIDLGIVAPEDQRWLGQYMIPVMANATPNNFLNIAVVAPDKIFTKLAVDNVEQISMQTGSCVNKHFNSLTKAKDWLQQQ